MRFFERQKIDSIGEVGVQLQKILIILFIADATGFLDCSWASIISTVISLVLLAIGFHGAHRRRENYLRFYFVASVVIITLGVLFIVTAFFFVPPEVSQSSSNGDLIDLQRPGGNGNDTDTNKGDLLPLDTGASSKTPVGVPQDGNDGAGTGSFSGSPSVSSSSSQTITILDLLLYILGFVLILVYFALKIQSLVLAAKMAKMLRACRLQHLAHPVVKKPAPSASPLLVNPFLSNTSNNSNHHVPVHAPHPAVVYIPMPSTPAANDGGYTPHFFNPFIIHPATAQYQQMMLAQQQQQQQYPRV